MCKLFMIVGAKNNKAYEQTLRVAAPEMSRSEKDGVGFTVVKKDKNIFTQRWHKNDEAFLDPKDESLIQLAKLSGALEDVKDPKDIVTNTQGTVDFKQAVSSIMHTRMATCGKEFKNVHPFNCNDNVTSLVHNGIIHNHTQFDKLNSTCDSEVLLTEYMRLDIANNPDKIAELVSGLDGYWAVGVTSVTKEGRRILDIFRGTSSEYGNNTYYSRTGGGATLYSTYVDELKGYVFCTTEYILSSIAKEMKWKMANKVSAVKPDVLIRFDATTGEIIMVKDFASQIVRVAKTHKLSGGKGGNSSTTSTTHSNVCSINDSKRTGPNSRGGMGTVDRAGTLCRTAQLLTDGDLDDFLDEGNDTLSNSKFFFGKELEDAIDDTKKEIGEEATDSKYFQELTSEDLRDLDNFMEFLDEAEVGKLNELPTALKYTVIYKLAADQGWF